MKTKQLKQTILDSIETLPVIQLVKFVCWLEKETETKLYEEEALKTLEDPQERERIERSLKQRFCEDKSDADVRWAPRYSSTMEDDDMGRWARVAYAGKFDNFGFYKERVCRWEIAWVSKLEVKGEVKFTISYKFPSNSKHLFDNLEDAKNEVEKTFRWFMEMCGGNY